MSLPTKDITEVIKDAPSSTDTNGKSVVLADSNGNLSKISHQLMIMTELGMKAAAGAHISFYEFIKEYVQGKPVGYMLSDSSFNNATAWYLDIKEGLSVNLQRAVIMISKTTNNIDRAWAAVSIILFPGVDSPNMYTATYQVNASTSDVTITARKIELSAI